MLIKIYKKQRFFGFLKRWGFSIEKKGNISFVFSIDIHCGYIIRNPLFRKKRKAFCISAQSWDLSVLHLGNSVWLPMDYPRTMNHLVVAMEKEVHAVYSECNKQNTVTGGPQLVRFPLVQFLLVQIFRIMTKICTSGIAM